MIKVLFKIKCIIIVLLFISGCTKTKISEKDILGDWEAIKGEYQEVSFTVEDNEYRFFIVALLHNSLILFL